MSILCTWISGCHADWLAGVELGSRGTYPFLGVLGFYLGGNAIKSHFIDMSWFGDFFECDAKRLFLYVHICQRVGDFNAFFPRIYWISSRITNWKETLCFCNATFPKKAWHEFILGFALQGIKLLFTQKVDFKKGNCVSSFLKIDNTGWNWIDVLIFLKSCLYSLCLLKINFHSKTGKMFSRFHEKMNNYSCRGPFFSIEKVLLFIVKAKEGVSQIPWVR